MRKGDRLRQSLLPALVFLALSAYLGAALRGLLPSDLHSAPSTEEPAPLLLEGIALRRERALDTLIPPDLDGARLPAGTRLGAYTAPCSVLVFSRRDGLEALSPEEAADWTAGDLRAQLDAAVSAAAVEGGRAVEGFDWVWAALCPAEASPRPGERCRLRFAGQEEAVTAWVLSVSAPEDGACAVLFRLNAGGEYEMLRLCSAELLA